MNKLLTAMALGASLAVAAPTQAATITVTFNEQSVGTHIVDQYAGLGLHFSGTENTVTNGSLQNNVFVSDGNLIQWSVNPVDAFLTIDSLASKISFQHRRPANTQPVSVKLYNGATKVLDQTFNSLGTGFSTFSFDGSATHVFFNKVEFTGAQKYFVDNLKLTTVPVPMAAWLLGSAVPVLIARRRRA
jgi:hypothetical protein